MICYKMWPYEIDIYSCKGFDTSWIASSNQNVMICETALGMIGDSSLRLFRARSMTRWSNFTSKTAWHGFRWMNSNWIISQIKHFMVLRGRKHGFFGIAPRETTRQTRVVFCSGKGRDNPRFDEMFSEKSHGPNVSTLQFDWQFAPDKIAYPGEVFSPCIDIDFRFS